MDVTKLVPRQHAVVDISAAAVAGGAKSAKSPTAPTAIVTADIDNHAIAYAVLTSPTSATVVSRGPLGPFSLRLAGTDGNGDAVLPLLVPFEVVPATELKVAVSKPLDDDPKTPGIPAGW